MSENPPQKIIQIVQERTDLEFIEKFEIYVNEQLNLPENIQSIKLGIARFDISKADSTDGMEETDNASVCNFVPIKFHNLSRVFTKKEIGEWELLENETLIINRFFGDLKEQVFSSIKPLKIFGYTLQLLILGGSVDYSSTLIPPIEIQRVLDSGNVSLNRPPENSDDETPELD